MPAAPWNDVKSALAGADAAQLKVKSIEFIQAEQGASDEDLALISLNPSVEHLDLTHCVVERTGNQIRSSNGGAPLVTDEGIVKIAALPRLKWLNAAGSQITDRSCRALSSSKCLEMFSGDQTAITDAGLMALAKIHSLKKVSLRGAQITSSGVEGFSRIRPDVQVLVNVARSKSREPLRK